jgi:hypothetical protein
VSQCQRSIAALENQVREFETLFQSVRNFSTEGPLKVFFFSIKKNFFLSV